jgi:hypothetical protein
LPKRLVGGQNGFVGAPLLVWGGHFDTMF